MKENILFVMELMKRLEIFFSPVSNEKKIEYTSILLNEFEPKEIEKACIQVIKTRKYSSFPTLAEIREAVLESKEFTKEIEKYKKIIKKAVLFKGSGSKFTFEKRLINMAVENIGGWKKLCLLTEDELEIRLEESLKKAFLEERKMRNLTVKIQEKEKIALLQ